MRMIQIWIGGVVLDLRYVIRVLIGSPAFSVIAVLSLAIGIGANTAIFGAARLALLDPMPVDAPEDMRLVYWATPSDMRVSQINSSGTQDAAAGLAVRSNYSFPAFVEMLDAPGVPADLFGFNFLTQITVSAPGHPSADAGGLMVSGSYFDVLRPRLALGRSLRPEDDRLGAPPVAVIGHRFWTRALASDPDVIGLNVLINETPFTIVGVTAEGFHGMSTGGFITPVTDVTVPLATQPLIFPTNDGPLRTATDRLWVRVAARMHESATDEQLVTALTPVMRRSAAATGLVTGDDLSKVGATILPGARGVDSIGQTAERPLTILAAVAGLVLLIACVNLASLMLARGVARQRELAIRRALGAGRARLIRQLLTESAVLTVLGAAAGILLASWTSPVIGTMMATGLGASIVDLPLDWQSLAVTAAVAGGAMLLSGLLPAVRLSRAKDTTHLRQRAVGAGAPRLAAGRVLLALQIGISLPLIVTAGLLLQSVLHLGQVDLGFNPSGLTLFRVQPGRGQPMTSGDRAAFMRRLLDELHAIPGVTSATVMENALVSGWVSNNSATINGEARQIYMNAVGPDYFDTMETPLIAGRAVGLGDDAGAPRVVVINQTAARRYFGEERPIGQRFTYGPTEAEIVGIAADSKYASVRGEVPPTLFDSILQRGGGTMNVAMRTAAAIPGLERQVQEAVAATGLDLPVSSFRSQRDQINANIGRERLLSVLLSTFGGFVLLLACVGLYGVTAYSVARRTNEIGIRIALGARRSQVLWMVLRQVLTLAVAGLAIGVPAALQASPLAAAYLYGLGPRDVSTVLGASALMLAVALGAGLVPANRAARLEALSALRQD